MLLLNFSHPLTAEHMTQIEALAGQAVERVVDVPVQVEPDGPLAEQIAAVADAAGLNPEQWQTLPLLVNLPGYAPAAAALLAELYGRMGHFPSIVWKLPMPDSLPRRFQVSQIIDLQSLRDRGRRARMGPASKDGKWTTG